MKNAIALAFVLSLSLGASMASISAAGADRIDGHESVEEAEYFLYSSSVTLEASERIRYLKGKVLESAAVLPQGTVLSIPTEKSPENYDYRDTNGNVQRSSNGFYGAVKIIEIPVSAAAEFPQEKIDALNAVEGGLFITSQVISDQFSGAVVPAIQPADPGQGFLANFDPSGRPKASFTQSFIKRFGSRLNLAIPAETLPESERVKWIAVFRELARISDRTRETDASLLFMPTDQAIAASIQYENQGVVQSAGAWTIAVKGTAPRHDFANVPCAEFVSEALRQAYKRAGFDHREDFNDRQRNPLIWSQTAAVVRLADALVIAGWIPWDASRYRPVTGAPMMHETARTPGHAYLTAGDDGRFIVDNGSPRGRDLRATSDKIIQLMYRHGVFFLPPGVIPAAWTE